MGVGVRFSDLAIRTRNGARRVCVITPQSDIVLSRNRLELLRAGHGDRTLDGVILDHLASGLYEAMLFRASNDDGSARYYLDPELNEDERLELVALLLDAHLRFFREIEKHGLFAMIGVGFSERDVAVYEKAADALAVRLAASMKGASDDEVLRIRTDQWLLERQAVWSAVPFEAYVETKLASALVAAERQHKSFIRLAGSR